MWMFLGFRVRDRVRVRVREREREREVENDKLAFRGHGRILVILLLCSVPLS
jgi:hypothetical protein